MFHKMLGMSYKTRHSMEDFVGFKQLRQNISTEEFDYQILISNLAEFSNQRDAITRLMRSEKIIRVKKGLYVFGADYRRTLVCKEALANQIYGPSYISLEYALSFYGMIPERVEVLTSITTGRSRKYNTPIGVFSYQFLPTEKYAVGITLKQLDEYHAVFIASPEKALLDSVYFSRGLTDKSSLEYYFQDDMRIDEGSLKSLSQDRLMEIANHFSTPRINHVLKFIRKLHNHA
jgi:predicted transcriptional regulator of viral defense system